MELTDNLKAKYRKMIVINSNLNFVSKERNQMLTFKELLNEKDDSEEDHVLLSRHYHFKDFPTHKKVLKNYSDSSRKRNSYLWKKHNKKEHFEPDEGIEKKIGQTDETLKHHSTPHEIHVYSGIGYDPREKKNENNIVHHPAYLSTSLDKKIAAGFGRMNSGGKTETHILKLKIPKGHPGAYIAEFSHIPSEKEFVLPRGLNIKLIGHFSERKFLNPNSKTKKRAYTQHTHKGEIV